MLACENGTGEEGLIDASGCDSRKVALTILTRQYSGPVWVRYMVVNRCRWESWTAGARVWICGLRRWMYLGVVLADIGDGRKLLM
eukprot:m.231857 g.231857  ORF g.231857 m.231857 type:complete len:85 (+) comp19267_c0_seq44:437-691(+)